MRKSIIFASIKLYFKWWLWWWCITRTCVSAKITLCPGVEPTAFGIHVLVNCGFSSSWSWSTHVDLMVVSSSRKRYWDELRKLRAGLGFVVLREKLFWKISNCRANEKVYYWSWTGDIPRRNKKVLWVIDSWKIPSEKKKVLWIIDSWKAPSENKIFLKNSQQKQLGFERFPMEIKKILWEINPS